MNKPNSLTIELLEYREKMAMDREGLSPEEAKDIHQRAVLRFLGEKLAWYEELSRQSEEREDKAETAQQAADVLPSVEVLQKITRYEGALNRELYRAMNQLERLQRRRDGENVAAPFMMDVTK
jgi:CRISPR/Cas system-associated endonuclease Cas1